MLRQYQSPMIKFIGLFFVFYNLYPQARTNPTTYREKVARYKVAIFGLLLLAIFSQ
jgi:hypothetical protein